MKSLSGRGFLLAIDHDGYVTQVVTAKLAFKASPATVWGMFTSGDYIDFKRSQASDFGYEMTQNGDQTLLTFTRPITSKLPGPAAALLGANPQAVEIQKWGATQGDGSRHADIAITIAGAPANIIGAAELTGSATNSEVHISISISVSIPFFGSTAENLIRTELEKFIELEQELGTKWLEAHGA